MFNYLLILVHFISVYLGSPTTHLKASYDIDKLAYCVAQAETQNCTTGVGKTKNNCFGIKRGGSFISFKTPQSSYEAFKGLWQRGYGAFPTLRMAARYTNNDRPQEWLNIVNTCYNKKP